jgi:hypothetical protein
LSIILSVFPLVPSFASSDQGGILLACFALIVSGVLLVAFFASLRDGAQNEELTLNDEAKLVDRMLRVRNSSCDPLQIDSTLRSISEETGVAERLAGLALHLEVHMVRLHLSAEHINWLREALIVMNDPTRTSGSDSLSPFRSTLPISSASSQGRMHANPIVENTGRQLSPASRNKERTNRLAYDGHHSDSSHPQKHLRAMTHIWNSFDDDRIQFSGARTRR